MCDTCTIFNFFWTSSTTFRILKFLFRNWCYLSSLSVMILKFLTRVTEREIIAKNWKKKSSLYLLLSYKDMTRISMFYTFIVQCSFWSRHDWGGEGREFWLKLFLDLVHLLALELFKNLSGADSTSLPCYTVPFCPRIARAFISVNCFNRMQKNIEVAITPFLSLLVSLPYVLMSNIMALFSSIKKLSDSTFWIFIKSVCHIWRVGSGSR